MRPEWPTIPLGQVGEWLSGGTPDKSKPEYWGGTVPWISPKDMKSLELWESEDHVTERGLAEGSLSVEPGTVMIVVRGMILAHTLPVGITMKRMAFNQDIKAIRCRQGVLPRFLAWWLVASAGRILCKVTDTSHGTKRFDIRHLQRHPFPVPPEEEQRGIARILDAVATAIERTREVSRRAREVKRALSQRVFREGVRREKLKTTPIGRIPESWAVVAVESVVDEFQYGLSVPMQTEGPMPILRMGNLQAGDVVLDDLKYVSLPERVVAP